MDYKKICCLLILSILIKLCSLEFGMLWDNVLFASKMGTVLFENGLFNWASIPPTIDPGHPPFLATLMATSWCLFGKSLAVSHWVMLPFVFGLLWQISLFVNFFIHHKKLQLCAFVLVIADPTLLAQLVLVNPEVIQLFFFFFSLNAILNDKLHFKVIGLMFLGMVSYRGMMLCMGIFLIDFFKYIWTDQKKWWAFFDKKTILTYAIGALPAIAYISWRLITKGWISTNPLAEWGSAWQYQSSLDFFKNFSRNIIVLGYLFSDFGRIILLLFILTTLYIKRKVLPWNKTQLLLIIAIFSTIVIYTTSLLIKNSMGHRYFIPSYLALSLLAFVLIEYYHLTKTIYTVLLSSLLLGNLIVYPDDFAQGWDASLAHIPYWNLRKNAIHYLDENDIPISTTATFFPNITTLDHIDLNGDQRSFISFTGDEPFVLYSNVYNLTDQEFDLLRRKYTILKTFSTRNVRVEILKAN